MPDSDLDYAKVTGRLALSVADGSDPGDNPDIIYCDSGTVRITPLINFTRVADATPPFTVGHAAIDATVDANGYVTWNGQPYVWVVDLTSTKVNPRIPDEAATHRLEFINVMADGTKVTFPEATVRFTKDGLDGSGVNDLALVMPVTEAASTPIVRGAQGVGIQSAEVSGGKLLLGLSDGTELDAGELPVGPGGSDAGVAGYVGTPGTATEAAVAAKITTRVAVTEAPLSPFRYGAVANGTTNDTAAIQAAIDAAEASRGDVLLPGGTFVASGINLRSGVKLRGMGKGKTRILHNADTYAIRAQGTSGTPFVDCEVTDLTIVGDVGTPAQMAIQFEYVNGGLIARNDLGYLGNNGINYHYSTGGRIEGNHVHHCENFGILFFQSNRLSVVNNDVRDLTSAGKQHFGIQSKASQLCQITGNRVKNIAGHGLYAYSDGTMEDFGHVFSDNIVTDLVAGGSQAGIGIYLNTVSGIRLLGNYIDGNDAGGISLSAATRCTIEANTVLNGAGGAAGIGTNATTTLAAILSNTVDQCGQGILLTGTTKSRVAGNTITRGMSALSGLYALIGLRGAAANNVVEGNTALEGVARGLYEEGTALNNVVRNNTVGQTTGTAYSALGTGGLRSGNTTVATGGALTAVA